MIAVLQQEVHAAIESRGGAIWRHGLSDKRIDDNTSLTYFDRAYRLGGRSGTVHGWCTRRGEYVSVVLVFFEVEDAATRIAAQAD